MPDKSVNLTLTEWLCIVMVLALLCALFCLFVSYKYKIKFLNIQNQPKCEEQDLQYIQDFFQSVGRYLGDSSGENLALYRGIAADIYRHAPSKHWVLIEKIDTAISSGNHVVAWDSLKLLSQSLANDGIATEWRVRY